MTPERLDTIEDIVTVLPDGMYWLDHTGDYVYSLSINGHTYHFATSDQQFVELLRHLTLIERKDLEELICEARAYESRQ